MAEQKYRPLPYLVLNLIHSSFSISFFCFLCPCSKYPAKFHEDFYQPPGLPHIPHEPKSADYSCGGGSSHSTDVSAIPPTLLSPFPFTEKHENRRWSQEGPLEIFPLVLREHSWFGQ